MFVHINLYCETLVLRVLMFNMQMLHIVIVFNISILIILMMKNCRFSPFLHLQFPTRNYNLYTTFKIKKTSLISKDSSSGALSPHPSPRAVSRKPCGNAEPTVPTLGDFASALVAVGSEGAMSEAASDIP